MDIEKLKKEVNHRMSRLHYPDAMAAKFFLNHDDNELISLINKQDEGALLQFAIKHIEHLIYWITWHGHHCGKESDLMRLLLPDFLETVKIFAKEYENRTLAADWDNDFRRLNFKQYNVKLSRLVSERHDAWRDFNITEAHVVFLNQLNAFLSVKEIEIIEKAKPKLPRAENRFKDDHSVVLNACEVEVSFFTKDSHGEAAFSTTYFFDNDNNENDHWSLLCSEEDWREDGWLPKLENRCCYLMHEVIYHSNLKEEIFNIASVWIDTRVVNQDVSSFDGYGWHSKKVLK